MQGPFTSKGRAMWQSRPSTPKPVWAASCVPETAQFGTGRADREGCVFGKNIADGERWDDDVSLYE